MLATTGIVSEETTLCAQHATLAVTVTMRWTQLQPVDKHTRTNTTTSRQHAPVIPRHTNDTRRHTTRDTPSVKVMAMVYTPLTVGFSRAKPSSKYPPDVGTRR